MVRLRYQKRAKYWLHKNWFQFHYGTIKVTWTFAAVFISDQFQFHYGTIKVGITEDEEGNSTQFQFHYGTIKVRKKDTCQADQSNFNSTMVRLRYACM